MPGVPGQRSGPVPKRTEQRRRRNKDSLQDGVTYADGASVVPVPPAFEDWDEIAADFYESLPKSGQSQFYEPSDWAVATIVAESLSRDLKGQVLIGQDGRAVLDARGKPMVRKLPLRGASLTAYLRAFQVLLVTEGDRRRLRLELQRPGSGDEQPQHQEVPNLDDYRGRLAAG